MTEQMQAVLQRGYGGPEVLSCESTDVPTPGPRDVLVRVHAVGVNPVDWKTRRSARRALPFIPGWDLSGIVEQTGEHVRDLQPGDAVFGMVRFPDLGSTYAEYVAAPSSQLARKPDGIDHEHAAAVPLAGLTAYRSLVGGARLEQGQRVTIYGAAGGVGHLAVQIAAALGADVTAVAAGKDGPWLKSLGAARVIDYHHDQFWTELPTTDAVLDLVGLADSELHLLGTVVDGGVYVCVPRNLHAATVHAADARQVRTRGFFVSPSGTGMRHLADLIQRKRLSPVVEEVFPLEEAARAHARGESGHFRGKLVLRTDSAVAQQQEMR